MSQTALIIATVFTSAAAGVNLTLGCIDNSTNKKWFLGNGIITAALTLSNTIVLIDETKEPISRPAVTYPSRSPNNALPYRPTIRIEPSQRLHMA